MSVPRPLQGKSLRGKFGRPKGIGTSWLVRFRWPLKPTPHGPVRVTAVER